MQTAPTAIAAGYRGMAVRPDVASMLPSIDVPTLLIVGEHDAITPAAEMKTVAEHIPNATYVVIKDAGHMSPLEKPIPVNQAIRDFVVKTK
jgi:pimeloyl-ACP methyl ester carboxylesterase